MSNPPNPWHSTHVEYLDAPPPDAGLELYEENARSVLSENRSGDVPFRWSVNPYRGCTHGCAYCYARTSHQQLGFGAGTDFDRRVVVKVNAPEVLRASFEKRSWAGEPITFSGNTDCYQGVEAHYGLTRRCLEVCRDFRNPVSVITKGALVARDVDVLSELARVARASVFFSIAFDDDAVARKVEPWAPSPTKRFAAMKALADAGVTVAVLVAPVIPGLSEHMVPGVLERAAEAGATGAGMQLLRLDETVGAVWDARMREAFPDRFQRIDHALVELRRGRRDGSATGSRMKGEGPRWEAVRALFHGACKRLGLNREGWLPEGPTTFKRPSAQGELFG